MSAPQNEPFQVPADPERYRECPRCKHTFDKQLVDHGVCPWCKGALYKQPVLPGADELALRRAHRQQRNERS